MDRSAALFFLAVHAIVMGLCGAASSVWTVIWTAFLAASLSDPTAPAVLDWLFGIGLGLRAMLLLPTLVTVLLTGASAASLRRGERRFVVATVVAALLVPLLNLTVSLMTFDVLGFAWLFSWVVGIVTSMVLAFSLQGTRGRDDRW